MRASRASAQNFRCNLRSPPENLKPAHTNRAKTDSNDKSIGSASQRSAYVPPLLRAPYCQESLPEPGGTRLARQYDGHRRDTDSNIPPVDLSRVRVGGKKTKGVRAGPHPVRPPSATAGARVWPPPPPPPPSAVRVPRVVPPFRPSGRPSSFSSSWDRGPDPPPRG